eukprot:GGOE01052950.1.p1 GENE.GGOE01052950.1~~GGOE01052950.1.p1  ORF type:complete len:433 (-),score=102.88 GGOE01052950.1:320-1618(-)
MEAPALCQCHGKDPMVLREMLNDRLALGGPLLPSPAGKPKTRLRRSSLDPFRILGGGGKPEHQELQETLVPSLADTSGVERPLSSMDVSKESLTAVASTLHDEMQFSSRLQFVVRDLHAELRCTRAQLDWATLRLGNGASPGAACLLPACSPSHAPQSEAVYTDSGDSPSWPAENESPLPVEGRDGSLCPDCAHHTATIHLLQQQRDRLERDLQEERTARAALLANLERALKCNEELSAQLRACGATIRSFSPNGPEGGAVSPEAAALGPVSHLSGSTARVPAAAFSEVQTELEDAVKARITAMARARGLEVDLDVRMASLERDLKSWRSGMDHILQLRCDEMAQTLQLFLGPAPRSQPVALRRHSGCSFCSPPPAAPPHIGEQRPHQDRSSSLQSRRSDTGSPQPVNRQLRFFSPGAGPARMQSSQRKPWV